MKDFVQLLPQNCSYYCSLHGWAASVFSSCCYAIGLIFWWKKRNFDFPQLRKLLDQSCRNSTQDRQRVCRPRWAFRLCLMCAGHRVCCFRGSEAVSECVCYRMHALFLPGSSVAGGAWKVKHKAMRRWTTGTHSEMISRDHCSEDRSCS